MPKNFQYVFKFNHKIFIIFIFSNCILYIVYFNNLMKNKNKIEKKLCQNVIEKLQLPIDTILL
jgi:competence protein ComGC